MAEDILSRIEQKLPSLSKGQRCIAAYILERSDKAAFLTASALGKSVRVSESTVVRFACLIGYDGYPEMQRALQQTVLTRLTSAPHPEPAAVSARDLLCAVLQDDAERLRKTAQALDRAAFGGALTALLQARRVYLYAPRACAALAVFTQCALQAVLDDVRLLDPSCAGELCAQMLHIAPQDVFFAMHFGSEQAAALRALAFCRQAGAKSILLSECGASDLTQSADYALCAHSGEIGLSASLVAPMSVINALLVSISEQKRAHTEQTKRLLKELRSREQSL